MKLYPGLALTTREPVRYVGLLIGAFIYSIGVNFFMVPADLYTGGIMGISQVLRTLLTKELGLSFGSLDIAGILYYALNAPILLVAWHRIEHRFVFKTLVSVTAITIFLSVLPVYDVMVGCDQLTKSLIGAICSGTGVGIILFMGGTSGGMDVVGLILMKAGSHISVGRINLLTNCVLYTVCAILFTVPTAIFSVFYSFIFSFTVDKLHTQNINVEVMVITKVDCHEMEQEIFKGLHRGVTRIFGEGAYTSEPVNMLYIIVSKYEVNHLRSIVNKYDPHAFVVAKNNAAIYGNYLKKL